MNLNATQCSFLADEFGLSESKLYSLAPLPLWRLREDCIEIECDEAMIDTNSSTVRGDVAASIVDVISSILPNEWKRKTLSEVEAMCANSPVDSYIGIAEAV